MSKPIPLLSVGKLAVLPTQEIKKADIRIFNKDTGA
jgi:hypothetical protein